MSKDSILETRVKIKLDEITMSICQYLSDDTKIKTMIPGLHNGGLGLMIFLSYYNKFNSNCESKNRFNILFNRNLEQICNGFYLPSYCVGISGTLYGIEHLNKCKHIDVDISEVNLEYHKYLSNVMMNFIHAGNYDFLHGAIGIAISFIECGENQRILSTFLNILESKGVEDNNTIKWLSDLNSQKSSCYNIAMSHGMSSIVIFLCRMINASIDIDRCKWVLNKTINYILKQEIDVDKYGSYFPYTSIESEVADVSKSRMAWCYGDLGVASAIWQAGKTLNNQQWKDKAIEVFLYATTRTDLDNNLVRDAGICHGTAGIAQIFKRMYLETDIEDFKVANEYWINETLKMAKFEDGAAGYKAYHLNEQSVEWKSDFSFLEGIAGIGLSLISYLSDNLEDSAWDEVLLLS